MESVKNELNSCKIELLESNPKVTSINQKLEQSNYHQKINSELKAKLSDLGVKLNPTLKKIISFKTQQEVNNAMSAVEEYLSTGKKVKSKAGLLRKALEESWIPNLTEEERVISKADESFCEWFKLAKDQGIIIASQNTSQGILVLESNDEWTPMQTMIEKGWTLEYLQERSKR